MVATLHTVLDILLDSLYMTRPIAIKACQRRKRVVSLSNYPPYPEYGEIEAPLLDACSSSARPRAYIHLATTTHSTSTAGPPVLTRSRAPHAEEARAIHTISARCSNLTQLRTLRTQIVEEHAFPCDSTYIPLRLPRELAPPLAQHGEQRVQLRPAGASSARVARQTSRLVPPTPGSREA